MRLGKYISEIKEKQEMMRPLCMTIFPTNNCSCKCKMCDIPNVEEKIEIDFEILKQSINSFFEMGGESIVFTGGGEPTMHSKFTEIIEHIEKKGLKNVVGILSNGVSSIDYTYISNMQCVRFIRFSIDALGEKYKSIRGVDSKFVVESLESVLKHKTRINTLILKDNIASLPAVINLAEEYGITVNFQIAVDVGDFKNEINIFELKKILRLIDYKPEVHNLNNLFNSFDNIHNYQTCVVPLIYIVIDAYGEVYPCIYGCNNLNQSDKNISYGNINKIKLPQLWSQSEMFRKELFSNFKDNDICRKCSSGGIRICPLHSDVRHQYDKSINEYNPLFL